MPPPQDERALAALPAHYPALPPGSAPGAAAATPDVRWADLFADPELLRLQQAALVHNSDLQAWLMRVEEARAAAALQSADALPLIGVGAQGVRARAQWPLAQEDSLLPAPLAGALQGAQPDSIVSHYGAALAMPSYEIDFWGKLRAMKRAARDRYLASAEAQQAFRSSLLAQVSNTWLQMLELQQRLELARATLQTDTEIQRILRSRSQAGVVSDAELRQMEALLATTRSEIAALQQAHAAQRALMAQLTHLGDVPDGSGHMPLAQWAERSLPAGLPAELLLRRADIRAAEWQLQAARANVQAARAAFLPSITLTAGGGVGSSALADLFEHGTRTWLFVPRISLPLFDGGRRQAHLDVAQARRHQAVAQYESLIQQAFREVCDMLSARHWLGEQAQQAQALVQAQSALLALADKRYERGYSGHLEVLQARRAYLAAQQRAVQLHRARLSSLVGLYAALGAEAVQPLLPAAAASASLPSYSSSASQGAAF